MFHTLLIVPMLLWNLARILKEMMAFSSIKELCYYYLRMHYHCHVFYKFIGM